MAESATIVVNDRMQRGYRYQRTAPIGADFDPSFAPELTPAEMLELGVFGGRYMTDCREEFPADWFARARLSPRRADPEINFFGVLASKSLVEWRAKGWIHPDDPRGWFLWYCRYYSGRRMDDDARQSAAGAPSPATPRRSAAIASPATRSAARASARRCCNGPMIAG